MGRLKIASSATIGPLGWTWEMHGVLARVSFVAVKILQ